MVIQVPGKKVIDGSFGIRTVFWPETKLGVVCLGGVQNCWNNIKVIPLSGLEIKVNHIWFNSGMMQTSF